MRYEYSIKKQLIDLIIAGILLPFTIIFIFSIVVKGALLSFDTFILGSIIAIVFTSFLSLNLKGVVICNDEYIERESRGVKFVINWKDVDNLRFRKYKSQLEIFSGNRKLILHNGLVNHKILYKDIIDKILLNNPVVKIPTTLSDYLKKQ